MYISLPLGEGKMRGITIPPPLVGWARGRVKRYFK